MSERKELKYVTGLLGLSAAVDLTDSTILFTHIPKAAGTTLDRIFEGVARLGGEIRGRAMGTYLGQFPRDDKMESSDYLRQKIAATTGPFGVKYMSGHFPYGVHEVIPRACAYVTLLRDPIQRCLSHFRMGLMRGAWTGDTPLAELFEQRLLLDNAQTRQISGCTDAEAACDETMLARAIHNLETDYVLFGTSEQFNAVLKALITLLGWPDILYSDFQTSDHRLSDAEEARLAAELAGYNEFDQALYAHAEDRPDPWRDDLFEAAPAPAPGAGSFGAKVALISADIKFSERQFHLFTRDEFQNVEPSLARMGVHLAMH